MTYYEHFRGRYESEMARIYERCQVLIDKSRELQPTNIDEVLAASEDGELDHALDWVDVPNPWQPADGDTITARPLLVLYTGCEDAEREEDSYDKGVYKLGIEALLPSGDTWYLGDITFFYVDGRPKHEPSVSLSTSPAESVIEINNTRWDSADAAMFLTLAESAIDLQQK
jgi:hypothetical protein